MENRLYNLARIAAVLAFCVIVLGAFVRLSHAGLGCPDWPGCYGQLTWPDAPMELTRANEAFPDRPVEVEKAWKEMVHRYLAGALVLLVLAINWVAWRGGRKMVQYRFTATLLLGLIIFQALLGMWTVTLKLLPVVVTAHLLGGMLTLALTTWLAFRSRGGRQLTAHGMRGWAITGIAVLFAQIALGGWTSANYAALSCPDLPMCTGQWWPDMDFVEGFTLFREVGVDYEGGLLDQPARAAIHVAHRIGAILTFLFLMLVGLRIRQWYELTALSNLLMFAVVFQVGLGISNILLKLPLAIAIAHNAGAAALVAILVWLLHRTTRRKYS